MATVGNTSTSFTSFVFADGSGTFNQNGSLWTMPENGVVNTVTVCCAADTAACNFQFVLWDGSGNVMATSTIFSLGTHARSTSGWSFVNATVPPTFVAAGSSIFIGFWRENGGSTLFPIASPPHSGGRYQGNNTSNSSAASLASSTISWGGTAGDMGAYITYDPVSAWVWNGSAWVPGEMDGYNGSAWTKATGIQVWNGSSWVNAT